jgi:hypothetical protein
MAHPRYFELTMSSIKITKDNVTRKIRVEETSSWDIVRQTLDVFSSNAGSIVLTYTDYDDDVITLSSIVELQVAMLEGIKKFDVSFSTDRDSSTSSDTTADAATVTTKREGSAGSEKANEISRSERESIPSREPSYYMEGGKRAISVERGAPSTLRKREMVERQWFNFLESQGSAREWVQSGPPVDLCAAFMHMIADTGVGKNEEKISMVWFKSIMETFLHLVSRCFCTSPSHPMNRSTFLCRPFLFLFYFLTD